VAAASVLFDTDVLIWVERGSKAASALVDRAEIRSVSLQTYLELLQGATSRSQQELAKRFLIDLNFAILPLSPEIGHRAAVYIEEYALGSGLRAGDALVAATAAVHDLELATANRKHFAPIRGLRLKVLKP
jgi:predicted nucleic acid-binding protein